MASKSVNVMDRYYPAHKSETEARFAEINRSVTGNEFCGALELARAAGLWRLDTRWCHVIPHGASVWLPQMVLVGANRVPAAGLNRGFLV